MKHLLILLSIVGIYFTAMSQRINPSKIAEPKEAIDNFLAQNYLKALPQLLELFKKDSLNIEYNQYIGVCYLNTYIDKSKAIPYLEYVTKQKKYDFYAWYDLGLSYMHSSRFDDAIKAFNEFITLKKGKDINSIPAERQIEMCKNAKELIKKQINVTFENSGSVINSIYPEYNVFVSEDEKLLVYTSRRSGNTGNLTDFDGYLTPDIYFSEFKNNKWEKPHKVSGGINTPYTEESVGMSINGDQLFMCIDDVDKKFKVLGVTKRGKTFTRPESLGANIYDGGNVTSASISKNGKTLIFSSDKNGGYGGMDLYISHRLPGGDWGTPKNIGDIVNTPFNDAYPSFSPDGNTLYFASAGHNSMGGYDIFKTIWNENDDSFSEPENIGYPINTTDDNKIISFTKSGRYAYISCNRSDAQGDLDIYKVIFKNVKNKEYIVKGKVLINDTSTVFSYRLLQAKSLKPDIDILSNIVDSLQKRQKPNKKNQIPIDSNLIETQNKLEQLKTQYLDLTKDIKIEMLLTNKKSKQRVGKYSPNRFTGNYVLIVQPGEYNIHITALGYKDQDIPITINDRESLENSLEIPIYLNK